MWQHPLGAAFFVFIFLKFFHIVIGSDLRDCTNDSLIIISSVWGLRAVRFRRGVKRGEKLWCCRISLRAVRFRRGVKRRYSNLCWLFCLRAVRFRRGVKPHFYDVQVWELCVFAEKSNLVLWPDILLSAVRLRRIVKIACSLSSGFPGLRAVRFLRKAKLISS